MRSSRHKKTSTKQHPLVGTWVSVLEWHSVEYTVTLKGTKFLVRAFDSSDGEEADILEIKSDGEELTFAAYWNSTGRFTRCRFEVRSEGVVDFTYTHTDQEVMRRKQV